MGAADHCGLPELARPRADRVVERDKGGQQQVAGLGELPAERGVDDVGGGEPVVHPRARGLPDPFLHDVDECSHVVVGDALAFFDRGDIEASALTDRRRVGARDDTELGPRLAREDLDLEPGAELRFVGEERGHLRSRVARDHGRTPSTAPAAMSRRKVMPGHEMRSIAA